MVPACCDSEILKTIVFPKHAKKKICLKFVINLSLTVQIVSLVEPGHPEVLSTGVRNPNQSRADMIFALSSLNK